MKRPRCAHMVELISKKNFTHWVKQRGEISMAQKIFPFKYEEEKKERGIISIGGLSLYLGLAQIIGLGREDQ